MRLGDIKFMPMTTQHKIKPQREKNFKNPKTFKTDMQQKPACTDQTGLDNQQPGQAAFEKFSPAFCFYRTR